MSFKWFSFELKTNMKTTLSQQEITDFWIRCYLGDDIDIFKKCIQRAYLDLNRTIHKLAEVDQIEKDKNHKHLIDFVSINCKRLFSESITNQDEFDLEHKKVCEELQVTFKLYYTDSTIEFHYGQAQKWINMTLKYLFAIGENEIPGITKNYPFYHIPIDNIIRHKMAKLSVNPIKIPSVSWSRLTYQEYINYQTQVRNRFKNQIPLDVEFRLFNNKEIE